MYFKWKIPRGVIQESGGRADVKRVKKGERESEAERERESTHSKVRTRRRMQEQNQ